MTQLVSLGKSVLQLVAALVDADAHLIVLVEIVTGGIFRRRKEDGLEFFLFLALGSQSRDCMRIFLPAYVLVLRCASARASDCISKEAWGGTGKLRMRCL